jgi:hypothetical protein
VDTADWRMELRRISFAMAFKENRKSGIVNAPTCERACVILLHLMSNSTANKVFSRMTDDYELTTIAARRRTSITSSTSRRLSAPGVGFCTTAGVTFEEDTTQTPQSHHAVEMKREEDEISNNVTKAIEVLQLDQHKVFRHVCTSVLAQIRAKRRQSWMTEKQHTALVEAASLQLNSIVEVVVQHGTKYMECIKNGIGRLQTASSTSKYEGELKHGVPNGIGVMTYSDGSMYTCVIIRCSSTIACKLCVSVMWHCVVSLAGVSGCKV